MCRWKLQLFMGGGGRSDGASSEGNVSLYLFALDSEIRARYSLAVISPTTTTTTTTLPDPLYLSQGSVKRFASASQGWGFLRFFPRDMLLATPGRYCSGDCITFEVRATVIEGVEHRGDASVPLTLSALSLLSRDMAKLYLSPMHRFVLVLIS